MKLISTFSAFVILLAHSEVSESYVCKECEVGPQVLKYFHPPDHETEDVGICKDSCRMKKKLIDPMQIEAARSSIYRCSKRNVSCEDKAQSKYRTIDGSCNNLKNPSWGMADICHRILLPHDYSDDVSSPRKSCLGSDLPGARVISNALHRETEILEDRRTFHFMEWGQTVAHDSSDTPVDQKQLGSCCKTYPSTNDVCLSEAVPPDDPFYIGKKECLGFLRTIPCSLCSEGTREALNKFTSYHDLSLLYGNSDDIEKQIRSYVNGMMKTQNIAGVGELPPPTPKDSAGFCTSLNSTHQCFLTGDVRIAQNPFAPVTNIVLLRNHNNICRKLKLLNPHWDDEKLYQEARRINIAQAQYITFTWYLPEVLGRRFMSEFKLEVSPGNKRTKYNPEMDPSTLDEIASAAHRYGHSFVPNSAKTEDPETHKNSTIYVKDYYFYPFEFYEGLLDRLALGMAKGRQRKHNLFYASSLRDYLLHKRNEKTFTGSDLASTTIIRGREHGLPGYSYYLKELFKYEVRSFCDLKRFMPPTNIRRLRKIYKSVYDIDLYTGGLAEYKVQGTILGPTFTTIIIIHSQRMKFADRYYFEHGNQAGSFTREQLLQIKKTSLSRIICDTTKISEIQGNVFFPPSKNNPVKSCESFPKVDLSPWSDSYKKPSHKVRKFRIPYAPCSVLWNLCMF